jgi:molecular chaperone HscB
MTMHITDDDFTLFGIAPRHALDRAVLDQRWRELQGEVHPDRFASEGAAAQRVAMQWAVRVNEAYQRLKDPLRRAAYLCELRGLPVDAERNTAMPGAFLMQQMSWREALDEAADAEAVERIDAVVAAAEKGLLADAARRLDSDGDTAGAAADVRALMFVQRFREAVQHRLDALDPTR